MNSVGILERHQQSSDSPAHFVKRSQAKYLESHSLVRKLSKNLYQLLIGLKQGIVNPVAELIRRWKRSAGGELLPPRQPENLMLFYPPKDYSTVGRNRRYVA